MRKRVQADFKRAEAHLEPRLIAEYWDLDL